MRARLYGAFVVLAVASACTGSSTSTDVTAPTSLKCAVTVANAMSGAAPAAGTTSTVDVTTTRDCTWTSATTTPWITITSGTSGQGSGSVAYRVAANADPAQRRGTLDVNNTQILVVQDPAPCRFSVTPPSSAVAAGGGTVDVALDTLTGCAWTAVSQAAWISISGAASGTKSATVKIAVAANGGEARTGTATIGGQTVTIEQAALPPVTLPPTPTPVPPPPPAPTPPTPEPNPPSPPAPTPTPAPPCTFSIAPSSASAPNAASTGTLTITASDACTWTVKANADWLAVTSAASGTGVATIAYAVAANTGAARNGTLTVADKTFTVSQAAAPPPCTFTIAPAGVSMDETGGSTSTAVTASAGTCAWTAASNAAWLTVTAGASGTGNGTVSMTVAANTGAARAGMVTVGGRTFTVTQAAPPPPPCTFSISPQSQSFDHGAGSGTVSVTASASTCAWTAATTDSWISITSGASGTGDGQVKFSVSSNSGAARNGTLTIAGKTFSVSQSDK